MSAALKRLATLAFTLAFMALALFRFLDDLSSEEKPHRPASEACAEARAPEQVEVEVEVETTSAIEVSGNVLEHSPEAVISVKIGNSAAAEPAPMAREAADECNH